jgi:hypothetical protein
LGRGWENALLMNRCDCERVRDGQKWRSKRITIDNAWVQGAIIRLHVVIARQVHKFMI